MNSTPNRRRLSRIRPLVIALLMGFSLAGCGLVTDVTSKYADEAHVEVTGPPDVPLFLVTSTDWYITIDEMTFEQGLHIEKADTTFFDSSISKTVDITPNYRVLFRVYNPSETPVSGVRMQVKMGSKKAYDETVVIEDVPMEFTYVYQ